MCTIYFKFAEYEKVSHQNLRSCVKIQATPPHAVLIYTSRTINEVCKSHKKHISI